MDALHRRKRLQRKTIHSKQMYTVMKLPVQRFSQDIPFPYTEYKSSELLQLIRQGERPPLPHDCPTHLAHLIKRCWDTDSCNQPSFLQVCNELLDFKRSNMMSWVLTTNRAVFQPRNQTRGSQSPWVFLYKAKLKWQEGYLCMLVTAWTRISLSLLLAIFKV